MPHIDIAAVLEYLSTFNMKLVQESTPFAFINQVLTLFVFLLPFFIPAEGASLPTFVFVPGAWAPPSQYKTLISYLSSSGYTTIIEANPSLNSSDPDATSVLADATALRNPILPLINEGKQVIVAMHSYGGFVGSTAAEGLSTARIGSTGGGIIGLLFISAFITMQNQSVLSISEEYDQDDSFIIVNV